MDGFNVIDDVGGLDGFHDFLATLAADESEEKERIKEWTKRMGWQAVIAKPEEVL